MFTLKASAGNPFTAVAGSPLAVCWSVAVSVPGVVLEPVPLWLVAGATTVTCTSGSAASAAAAASMPMAP
jgi:hypothetical protein